MVKFLSKKESAEAHETKLKKTVSLAKEKNWYKDKYQTVVVQRNVLIICTFLGLLGVVILGQTLAALSDSKIFEPFVIEINDKSGNVTLLDTKTVEKYSADEVVVRSLLARYVTSRESYQFHTYYYNFHEVVRLLSEGPVYRDFRFGIGRSNPDSPLNLQNAFTRDVEIKYIKFLEGQKALVSFVVKESSYPRGGDPEEKHYISDISFAFNTEKNFSPKERYINPLGFQVVGYKKDQEYVQ